MTCDDLALGAVTGPELEYAADADFHAEWVPIASLETMPVFPRCVAEHVARGIDTTEVPWVEDDRNAWDGIEGESRPDHLRVGVRGVVVEGRRLLALKRRRDGDVWYTLPGGGIEDGETAEGAAVREVREEVGLDVVPGAKLAVVVFRRDGISSLQTYVSCDVVGGSLGTGDGDEHTDARRRTHGTYEPAWLDIDELPHALRPAWLGDHLHRWVDDPSPQRPERFYEDHD